MSLHSLDRFPARELYDLTWRALDGALTISTTEELDALPSPAPVAPRVFITSWVDYTKRYGTAYSLSDGSAGLYYNDSTTMVLSPDKMYVWVSVSLLSQERVADGFIPNSHFDYISNRKGKIYSRRHYTVDEYPKDLDRKTYLLQYFEEYMGRALARDVEWTFVDKKRTKNMDFLVKYYRMKSAVVFKLSNEVLQVRFSLQLFVFSSQGLTFLESQFNFFDHTKVLLTQNGSVVSFVDTEFGLHTYALGSLFREACELGHYRSRPHAGATEKETRRLETLRFLIGKLEYCRDVLKYLGERNQSDSIPADV